ncbi:HPr family phosphocarrier protein [Frigoriglobus tundricola]|uniref:HPr family phosphocarrier protein n=1 Tax=Frigoriglobus tundricola TaxID=2774151 RepID=UPI0028F44B19|nr:HPr family phosphocarrier protein [Frigoriglobus tundricola]
MGAGHDRSGGGNGPGPREPHPPGPGALAPPDTPPPDARPPALGDCNDGPIRRAVRIANPLGLHMRVADRFSRTARQYTCAVIVWNGQTQADGKSLLDLIMLSAMPDSEVVLEVDGPDAHTALDPLAAILAAPGGEDYTI